jgi:hypothetical protein
MAGVMRLLMPLAATLRGIYMEVEGKRQAIGIGRIVAFKPCKYEENGI